MLSVASHMLRSLARTILVSERTLELATTAGLIVCRNVAKHMKNVDGGLSFLGEREGGENYSNTVNIDVESLPGVLQLGSPMRRLRMGFPSFYRGARV